MVKYILDSGVSEEYIYITNNGEDCSMKKVKDVFSLPVDASEVRFLSCHDRDPSLTENERLETAAHAINHVDALAEALELLLSDKAMIHVSNGKHLQAKAAIAAYRGEA